MTEAEWLACEDRDRMWKVLRGRTSDRKLRLLACAACRCVWQLLDDKRTQHALAVAERYAAGMANGAELGHAEREADEAYRQFYDDQYVAALAVRIAAAKRPPARQVLDYLRW
jgi:hypothetical protein